MNEELIKAMLSKEFYPHETTEVKLVQTHISSVFLTGKFVYKVKKAVKFSFLDYSTLEKRKFFCEKEVELNKRLCPEIYLGVLPITKEENEAIELNGKGKVLDYAVKMVQLPEEKKMVNLLEKNSVSKENVEEIARILAEFHEKLPAIRGKVFGSPEKVKETVDNLEIIKGVCEKNFGSSEKIDFILKKSDEFMEKNKELFLKRVEDGKIKRCHGDVYSENIFINKKICIFDCIEFNEDFTSIDVASEIAFLAMDLDFHGRSDLSNAFVEKYIELSKDEEALKLLSYYKCYRANVRTKVTALKLEQNLSDEEKHKAKELCWKYLKLTEKYAKKL